MYDLIILGAGPAGLTAAIYAARYNLKTLVISHDIGGQALWAYSIENYPGFKQVNGTELMQKMKEQAAGFGVEIKEEDVLEISKQKHIETKTTSGKYESKALIIALGTKRKELNVEGEKEFRGKGVSYCAICECAFFRNKTVAVVGGSNSAAMSALLLAEYAKKVYIIYRKEKLRAEPYRVKQIEKNKKIEVITKRNISEIKGDKFVNEVVLDNGKNIKLDGVFIEIGTEPNVEAAKKLGVKLCSEDSCIEVDEKQQTSVKGVYAAGDITNASNRLRQIVTAAAEGAIAANSVYEDIKHESI